MSAVLCTGGLSTEAIFKADGSATEPLDYQLALSIFHWLRCK